MGAPLDTPYYTKSLEHESKSYHFASIDPEQHSNFKSGPILYSGAIDPEILVLLGDYSSHKCPFIIGFTYRKIMNQYIFSEVSIGYGTRCLPILTGSLCLCNSNLGLYGGPSLLYFYIPGAILGWQLNEHVAIEMKTILYVPYSLSFSYSF